MDLKNELDDCPYKIGDTVRLCDRDTMIELYNTDKMFSVPEDFLTDVADKDVVISDIRLILDRYNARLANNAKYTFSTRSSNKLRGWVFTEHAIVAMTEEILVATWL